MGFADTYKARMKAAGGSKYERNYRIKSREFDLYFANSLNREDCLIDGKKQVAIFQDHSQSNNKDLSDDKYLILPNETKCDVGSYLIWRDSEWLVFTEEFKTIATHQQLKIKHVNYNVKWVTDRKSMKISNDGNGWGAYVQNQTLYTLGVSFTGNNVSLVNAKMMMYMQDNEETRSLEIGDRVFIGLNVYKIMSADVVSRVGLINFLLDEDTKNPEIDNYELGIADYWVNGERNKDQDKPKKPDNPKTEDKLEWVIEGETRAKLGRTYVYKAFAQKEDGTKEQLKVNEWIIENMDDMPFHLLEKSPESIQIRVIDDRRMVGKVATIMANINGEIKNIAVKVIAKFA